MAMSITPCLWFDGNAREAVNFYVSLFSNSRIDNVSTYPTDVPGRKQGDVMMIEFTLDGRAYQALNGGPAFKFNEAISISALCRDQTEVDRLWAALTNDGGRPVQCGWLQDKYGLFWQIVPERLATLVRSPDREVAKRVMEAMFPMVKIDVAAIEAAARG
jgi:predicted 3-demethylubiquinone-9 3-methyltransferase (glyoxalase superfamily)